MMQAGSRASAAAAYERLAAVVADGSAAELSDLAGALHDVVVLLAGEPALRRALTDPSAPDQARVGLLDSLLADRLSEVALRTLRGAVAARWSRPDDLVEAVETLARLSTLAVAEKDGSIEDVEDELFRFGRILHGQPALRRLLADPVAPAERRVELLDTLISGKVGAVTARLLTQAVRAPRGRSLDVVAEHLAALAAGRRDRYIAYVRAPAPLSSDQERRLTASLSTIYGRAVSLQVEIAPDLLGGLVVRVSDEVIDGSVSGRLERARQQVAGN